MENAYLCIVNLRFYYVNEPEQLSCTVYYVIIVIRGGDSAADRSVFNATNIIRSSSRWMLSYPGFDEETTGV